MEMHFYIKIASMFIEVSKSEFDAFDGHKKIVSGLVTEYYDGNKKVGERNSASFLLPLRYM